MTDNLPTPSQLLGAGNFNSWYPGQYDLLQKSLEWEGSPQRFLGMACPTGCHAAGQGILLYDGTIKKVEDVAVGDLLMGDDSSPRTVLELCRGRDLMVTVVPVKGTPFRVNLCHILSLKSTKGLSTSSTGKVRVNNGSRGGMVDSEIRDVSVYEYIGKSRTFKHITKLFRVPVDFTPGVVLPIRPYILGVLLGDGTFGHEDTGSLTNCSSHSFPKFHAEADRFDIDIVLADTRRKCSTIRFSRRSCSESNRFTDVIKSLGLWGKTAGDKFIPQTYKVASRGDRLELLAGLMDTDGHCERGGFDYISKSKQLAEDIAFLCRSVGLAAYVSPCLKRCQNDFEGLYFRIYISGDCSVIPARFRKASSRRQIKDVLVTGFSIALSGEDDFYGFRLDGNGRYLLGDFTVTHNSGKSLSSLLLAKLSGLRTVVLTATKGLQGQYQDMAKSVGGVVVKGQNNFPCLLVNGLMADEGPCHDGISCQLKEQCPYRVQVKRAQESHLVISNYAYWLAQTNFSQGLGDVQLLILDEAHQAFGALESYLTIFLSRMDLQSLGIEFPTVPDAWNAWRSWAEVSVTIAADNTAKLDMEIKQLRSRNESVPNHISRVYRNLRSVTRKLLRLASLGEDWIIQKTYHGYRFVPKWVAEYSGDLFHDVPKIVLMSAILSHRSADYLGVPSDGSRAWIEMPSHFPPQNTPIWHVPTARINYRTDDYGATIWFSRIDQVIQRRLDRKGIVFTVSYERAKMLMARSRFKDIMVTHGTNDVVDVVERFKKMPAPAVLVSPSVTTGYDFPSQETNCKYLVVGKIPYPDTQDPVTRARHEDDKEWTAYQAMETFVQECGRATRGPEDCVECLVLDDTFKWWYWKHKDFAPKWFQDRVRGSLESVPDPLV